MDSRGLATGVLAAGIVVAAGVLILELVRPSDPKLDPPPVPIVASQVPAVVVPPKAEPAPVARPEASPPTVASVVTPAAPVAEKPPGPAQSVAKEDSDPFRGIVAAMPPLGFKARNYSSPDREYEACYDRLPPAKSNFDEIQRRYLGIASSKTVDLADRCEAVYRIAQINGDLRSSLSACSRFLVDDYVMTLAFNNTRAALAAAQEIGCASKAAAPQRPAETVPVQPPAVLPVLAAPVVAPIPPSRPAPAPVAPVADARPAAPPKEAPNPSCTQKFDAQYRAIRSRESQVAGEMGQHMQWTPRGFWNLCSFERERLGLARRKLALAQSCPSAPGSRNAQNEANDTMQRVNRTINRPGCT